MCTVTFIPKGTTEFILTSNRDEAPDRVTLKPDFYKIEGTKMLFPKDEKAGGTWIGLSNKQRLVCLLNGGFTKHQRKAKYRESRGVVVKNLLSADRIKAAVALYNFHDIEPFTLVIVEWHKALKLYELVWDGAEYHFTELPIAAKLWSSSSLYNVEMKTERQKWFKAYLEEKVLSAESILKFHKTAGKGNENYGVVMNRGFVKTTSTTQIVKSLETITMRHHNLQEDVVSVTKFEISEIINE